MTASVTSNTNSQVATSETSFSADLPGTTVSGELLLALLANGDNSGSQTFPAVTGWTKNVESIQTVPRTYVGWSKTATGSDGATQTFTSGTGALWMGNVLRIADHNGINVTAVTGSETFDTTVDSPSVTTTVNDCLVLVGFMCTANIADRTLTPPGGTTAIFDEDNTSQGFRMAVRSFVQASAGATPAQTWTVSSGIWVNAFTIAIAPAAASGVPLAVFLNANQIIG